MVYKYTGFEVDQSLQLSIVSSLMLLLNIVIISPMLIWLLLMEQESGHTRFGVNSELSCELLFNSNEFTSPFK